MENPRQRKLSVLGNTFCALGKSDMNCGDDAVCLLNRRRNYYSSLSLCQNKGGALSVSVMLFEQNDEAKSDILR